MATFESEKLRIILGFIVVILVALLQLKIVVEA